MYDTAAIALTEASQKVSNSFFTDLLRFGVYVITRGMWMFSKLVMMTSSSSTVTLKALSMGNPNLKCPRRFV